MYNEPDIYCYVNAFDILATCYC